MTSTLSSVSSLTLGSITSTTTQSKHLREALERAKKRGGVVVVDSLTSTNPQVIAVESCYTSQDDHIVILNNRIEDAHEYRPPATKKCKTGPGDSEDVETSLKEVLRNIHKAMILRLDSMDKKLDSVALQCDLLEEKVEAMSQHLISNGIKIEEVADPSNKVNLGTYITPSKVTLIALNSENDYPEGSWLGDESNPEMRVRCPIVPHDLKSLSTVCRTPEKMALTLLDYLFDRETQACSNISGHGKHGKKQLDPLMIYGIKCHLMHKFSITERDWLRIKVNLDSKCRTAFRRKLKGMPLTVKAFRDKSQDYNQDLCNRGQSLHLPTSCTDGHQDVTMTTLSTHSESINVVEENGLNTRQVQSARVVFSHDGELDLVNQRFDDTPNVVDASMVGLDDKEALVDLVESQGVEMELGLDSIAVSIDPHSQIIHTMQGDIQVVHATPEQLAEIQRAGKIQILTDNNFLHEVHDVLNLSTSSNSTSVANVDLNSCILEADKMDPLSDITSPSPLPPNNLVDLKSDNEPT